MLDADKSYTPDVVDSSMAAIKTLDPETCRGLVHGEILLTPTVDAEGD